MKISCQNKTIVITSSNLFAAFELGFKQRKLSQTKTIVINLFDFVCRFWAWFQHDQPQLTCPVGGPVWRLQQHCTGEHQDTFSHDKEQFLLLHINDNCCWEYISCYRYRAKRSVQEQNHRCDFADCCRIITEIDCCKLPPCTNCLTIQTLAQTMIATQVVETSVTNYRDWLTLVQTFHCHIIYSYLHSLSHFVSAFCRGT